MHVSKLKHLGVIDILSISKFPSFWALLHLTKPDCDVTEDIVYLKEICIVAKTQKNEGAL